MEEHESDTYPSELNPDPEHDFLLLEDQLLLDADFEDDESTETQNPDESTDTDKSQTLDKTSRSVDVETIKRKANEIANTLQKFRSNRSIGSESVSSDPPAEFVHHHERSLYVAKKLEEDRKLYEESKRRSLALYEKVRDAKQVHKHLLEMEKEKKEVTGGNNEINGFKLKIEKLESTIQHLQECLKEKNVTISENNQTIRSLNESISDTYSAHMNSLEQSKEEIKRLTEEYSKKIKTISDSKEELFNQLQTIRKKYVLIENDLKLSDFARCRLVSRNTQLREKINALENENNKLQIDKQDKVEECSKVPELSLSSDVKQSLEMSILRPKIECIETLTNEFYSFVMNDDASLSDPESDTSTDSEDFVLKTADKIAEKLESSIYTVRDKLAAFEELREKLKYTGEKLLEMETSYNESKQQENKLKKLLASVKQKAQTEATANKNLADRLAAMGDERVTENEEWKSKYEQLRFELEETKTKLDSLARHETEADVNRLEILQNEYGRLLRENHEMAALLESLRRTSVAEEAHDKVENGFVVLQNAEQETESWKQKWIALRDEYEKLVEHPRNASEETTTHEREKISLETRVHELTRKVRDLEEVRDVEASNERARNDEAEKRRNAELRSMSNKLDLLEEQLIVAEDALRDERKYNDKLRKTIDETSEIHETAVKAIAENVALREDCEKFKNKLQRLQLYCKTNMSKSDEKASAKETAKTENIRKRLEETVDQWRRDTTRIADLTTENETLRTTNERLSQALNEARELPEKRSPHRSETAESDELGAAVDVVHRETKYSGGASDSRRPTTVDELAESMNEVHACALRSEAMKDEYLRLENEQLYAANERLSRALHEAREVATRLENSADDVVAALRSQNEELRAANERLSRALHEDREVATRLENSADDVVAALRSQNEELQLVNERLSRALHEAREVATRLENSATAAENADDVAAALRLQNDELRAANENLTRALNDAAAREVEQELGWRAECEKLRATNDRFERSARSTIIELERSLNDAREREATLQSYANRFEEIGRICEELHITNVLETLDEIGSRDTHEKLRQAYNQKIELLNEQARRTGELDNLKRAVDDITDANRMLGERCDEYRSKYVAYRGQVRQIIREADRVSRDTIELLDELERGQQQRKTTADDAQTRQQDSWVQCDDEQLERLRASYETKLSEQSNQFNDAMFDTKQKIMGVQLHCDELQRELDEKDFNFENYKVSVEQYFADERANYERYIYELQHKRGEGEGGSRTGTETEMADIELNPRANKLADYFGVGDEASAEFNVAAAAIVDDDMAAARDEKPSLKNFFNYYKGKLTKEISDILKPEEDEVRAATGTTTETDYSRYILPDTIDHECRTSVTDRADEATQTAKPTTTTRDVTCQMTSSVVADVKESATQTVTRKNVDEETQTRGGGDIKRQTTNASDSTTQTECRENRMAADPVTPTVIELIDRVKSVVENKWERGRSTEEEDEDDSYAQLDIDNAYFTNTALKFAELIETVLRYYLRRELSRDTPNVESSPILNRFREATRVIAIIELPEQRGVTDDENALESFARLIAFAIRIEFENRYLLNALTYVEEVSAGGGSSPGYLRFGDIIASWREIVNANSAVPYLAVGISEAYDSYNGYAEYEILPEWCVREFIRLCELWKRNVEKFKLVCSAEAGPNVSVSAVATATDQQPENIQEVYKILENGKRKVQRLICDIHDCYRSDNAMDPMIFFEQIEDVNRWIECSLKTMTATGEENVDKKKEKVGGRTMAAVVEKESVPPGTASDDEFETVEFADKATLSAMLKSGEDDEEDEHEAAAELKALLAESAKKIDSLVRELMLTKNSREYNEVQQLHTKLDETLYQLHLRDVHCVELTRELTQLLSERDALQLKLSTIIRQNEQLREATMSYPNNENTTTQSTTNLENKLEELHSVNYMRDPRISETSKQHHASQMQLFSEEQSEKSKENKDNVGFSVPLLLKWFTGDTEDK